jgi:hypothetical protein
MKNMKRRNVLLGLSGGLAAPAVLRFGLAKAAANADPSRLKSELMPLGGERAASKSGLVPAWTGGATSAPAGWTPGTMAPNLFAGQAPSFTVTQQNMHQYSDMLCDGQIQMLNRFGAKGYKFNVYPTARTAAAPQFVYDNTALNVSRVQPVDAGLVWGFKGGYLGIPFPILSDDPNVAGIQAMWNHQLRWAGTYGETNPTNFIGGRGSTPVIASTLIQNFWYRYYDPSLTLEQYERDPHYVYITLNQTAPANEVGEKDLGGYSSQYDRFPSIAFEYLVGEGRIRQAPDINYDIPLAQADDLIEEDEVNMWIGKMDHYTWTVRGKKEMIVPYNQWDILNKPSSETLGPDTVNPDAMRYEVHRVWVIEANVAPGKRDTLPHRFFYLDEDTWTILLSDAYDAQGNYYHFGQGMVTAQPELPGVVFFGQYYFHNLQANSYDLAVNVFADPTPVGGVPITFNPLPRSTFSPQSLANTGGL